MAERMVVYALRRKYGELKGLIKHQPEKDRESTFTALRQVGCVLRMFKPDEDLTAIAAKLTFIDEEMPDAKDKALTTLEENQSEEQVARNEERFMWIVICTILVDVLWFRNSTNALLPVVVMLLELVVLLVLARRMNIRDVVALLDRLLEGIGRGASGK